MCSEWVHTYFQRLRSCLSAWRRLLASLNYSVLEERRSSERCPWVKEKVSASISG